MIELAHVDFSLDTANRDQQHPHRSHNISVRGFSKGILGLLLIRLHFKAVLRLSTKQDQLTMKVGYYVY